MIMEKKLRSIYIVACSNLGTHIQLTLSEETSDLRGLVSAALLKLASFSTDTEYYSIEHIDSMSRLRDPAV